MQSYYIIRGISLESYDYKYPSTQHAKNFEKYLIPVILVFIG